jgi:hypothetical protein
MRVVRGFIAFPDHSRRSVGAITRLNEVSSILIRVSGIYVVDRRRFAAARLEILVIQGELADMFEIFRVTRPTMLDIQLRFLYLPGRRCG